MPPAVRLVEVEVVSDGNVLELVWRNEGNVNAPVPHRPTTSRIGWSLAMADEQFVFQFTVPRTRNEPTRALRVRRRRDGRGPPEIPTPATSIPDLSGTDVRLVLDGEDFEGWQGEPVAWSASTNWDRYDFVDECTTDSVVLRDEPVRADFIRLSDGFPLPPAGTMRFSERPRPQWRGAAQVPRVEAVRFFMEQLPRSGYASVAASDDEQTRGALTFSSTSLAVRSDDFEGAVVVTDVSVRGTRTETLLLIQRAAPS